MINIPLNNFQNIMLNKTKTEKHKDTNVEEKCHIKQLRETNVWLKNAGCKVAELLNCNETDYNKFIQIMNRHPLKTSHSNRTKKLKFPSYRGKSTKNVLL